MTVVNVCMLCARRQYESLPLSHSLSRVHATAASDGEDFDDIPIEIPSNVPRPPPGVPRCPAMCLYLSLLSMHATSGGARLRGSSYCSPVPPPLERPIWAEVITVFNIYNFPSDSRPKHNGVSQRERASPDNNRDGDVRTEIRPPAHLSTGRPSAVPPLLSVPSLSGYSLIETGSCGGRTVGSGGKENTLSGVGRGRRSSLSVPWIDCLRMHALAGAGFEETRDAAAQRSHAFSYAQ